MAVKTVIAVLGLIAGLAVGLFIAVAVMDPLMGALGGVGFGQFGGEADAIHEVVVKWLVPIGAFSAIGWGLFSILRSERQTVR